MSDTQPYTKKSSSRNPKQVIEIASSSPLSDRQIQSMLPSILAAAAERHAASATHEPNDGQSQFSPEIDYPEWFDDLIQKYIKQLKKDPLSAKTAERHQRLLSLLTTHAGAGVDFILTLADDRLYIVEHTDLIVYSVGDRQTVTLKWEVRKLKKNLLPHGKPRIYYPAFGRFDAQP